MSGGVLLYLILKLIKNYYAICLKFCLSEINTHGWMKCVGSQLTMNVCQRINILLTNFDSFNCRIKIVFDFTVNKTYL